MYPLIAGNAVYPTTFFCQRSNCIVVRAISCSCVDSCRPIPTLFGIDVEVGCKQACCNEIMIIFGIIFIIRSAKPKLPIIGEICIFMFSLYI